MSIVFKNYLRLNTQLQESAIDLIADKAFYRKLKRNETLLEEGQICHQKTFIIKGLVRTFALSEDGNEHILQFSPEDTWTLDAESYDQQMPSRYFISAIESSEVLCWEKEDFNKLLLEIPELRKLSEQLISRTVHASRQRILTSISASPEQKYGDFITQNPNLLNRLPLRMIASYLGISLKTLNRVRHEQLLRT